MSRVLLIRILGKNFWRRPFSRILPSLSGLLSLMNHSLTLTSILILVILEIFLVLKFHRGLHPFIVKIQMRWVPQKDLMKSREMKSLSKVPPHLWKRSSHSAKEEKGWETLNELIFTLLIIIESKTSYKNDRVHKTLSNKV